jgi:hypothetical protein
MIDELSGWFRLCLQQRRDTRHMVLPRFTEIHAHCLNDIANHLSSLFAEVRRADKAGEDTSELTEKLVQEALRYGETSSHVNWKPFGVYQLTGL